ncbi:MAG: four helix bundle protein [Candidatus Riflebacteria bacterium]|nr:four helix bundle protein [Candidatus Riflebacteria bacterium]
MKDSLLANKTVDFAIRIVKFYKYLCSERKEYVLSKQILKSGTSIGANVRESRNAQSLADFINKLNIALKEADETQYWLEIIEKSEIITSEQIEGLNNDLKEIIAILISSIKTLKKKLNDES